MSVASRIAPAWTQAELADVAAVSRRLRERRVRLDPDEVRLVTELIGRPPLWPEAVLFGILWSEHCSYKSTRHLLKRLPTTAPQVVLGPGEDAGVVALPAPHDDLVLVLGHESHNHPSQVLPVEGAATGVGGIVRDVACMGADVVGVLDGLRFGNPRSGVAARDTVRGVVQGIAEYGNALGVPNLGGDAWFDPGFDGNCLVNVCAVGLAKATGLKRSRVPDAKGAWVFVLVGKPTDESGFGGAAFASEQLSDADDRGAVQLPDPFLERVLLVAGREACARLEALGIPAGFKDLGAGGVACATSELAAAGGRGATIELERVHRVARPLAPEVLLCAETQERFCWVVPESFAAELCDLYNREFALGQVSPGAAARVIGRVTDTPRYVVTWDGETVVDCPVEAITSGRRIERPAKRRPAVRLDTTAPAVSADTIQAALTEMMGDFRGGSLEYLTRHYDVEVQGRTWLRRGEADAVVIRARPEESLGLAFALAGNPRWCAADAELGARHAVAEAARRVAATGARPWALTDCLNFGDAEDPAVMGDLEAAIDGLAAAAAALGGLAHRGAALPFVSGNVSLYNHRDGRSIPPSPIVMCAGVIDPVTHAVPLAVTRPGAVLVRVGVPRAGLALSGVVGHDAPPPLDLEGEARLQALAVESAAAGWAWAAHSIGVGGVARAVAEMLLAGPPESRLGAALDVGEQTPWALYDESPGIVFAVAEEHAAALSKSATSHGIEAHRWGVVTEDGWLAAAAGSFVARWEIESLRALSSRALEALWNEELET